MKNNYFNEEAKELVNDETDWGNSIDDMTQNEWEDHMGGPDEDFFEQHAEEEHI